MEERWAQLPGGRMRYLVGGEGHALVLVHGIAASSFSFRFNSADLARNFRVFVPDFLALEERPTAPASPGSLSLNALRMIEFLDVAGIHRAHLLGSSYGGALVMEMARLAPDRIARMILVSPANPFARRYHRVVRFYLSPIGGAFIRLVPFFPGWAWDYGIGRMYGAPSSMMANTGVGYARALRSRSTIRAVIDALQSFVSDVEALREHLSEIGKVPALLIWGDRDPVVEIESSQPLQEQLGARLAVMHAAGHLPYEERPEEFSQIVRDFLLP